MAGFLIDVNLPYRFSLWSGNAFLHMRDLGEHWSDSEIWRDARAHDLVIVTKDTDFSDRSEIVRCRAAIPFVPKLCLGMRSAKLRLAIGGRRSLGTSQ